jgi:hypothetical protein
MDCASFRELELDLLYGELEAAGRAEMTEHSGACDACAARFDRLRRTREVVAGALAEPVPSALEARVLEAVDAALAAPRASATSADGAPAQNRASEVAGDAGGPALHAKQTGDARRSAGETADARRSAKVFAFLSRPQLAVAAAFVVVIGAVALFARTRADSAGFAAGAAAPAVEAARADDQRGSPRFAEAKATAVAPSRAVASAGAGGLEPGALGAAPPTAGGGVAPTAQPRATLAAGRSAAGPDPALGEAGTLYAEGRCAEALPKLEALANKNGEADLYAARCVEQTRGCSAAAPRYDAAARRHAGTSIASEATLDSARCYDASGKKQVARARYEALENDPYVGREAQNGLASLEGETDTKPSAPAAGASPVARPAATATAAAKAAPARPAAPAKPAMPSLPAAEAR